MHIKYLLTSRLGKFIKCLSKFKMALLLYIRDEVNHVILINKIFS